jgi:hypothetical protein
MKTQTLTIRIKDLKALKLLEDLEALKLIQVIRKTVSNSNGKLSSILSGSLTESQAATINKELDLIRGEWERGI